MNYSMKQTASCGGITLYEIESGGATARASTALLPQSDAMILTVICQKGMLLCRLYECAVAERLGCASAVFSAATIDDMLKKQPVSLTAQAVELGATAEMTGLELLHLFS